LDLDEGAGSAGALFFWAIGFCGNIPPADLTDISFGRPARRGKTRDEQFAPVALAL
jgi:hypothetical protein